MLGNNEPECGAIGEIVTTGAFYDYDSKYRGGETKLSIPAELGGDICERITDLAAKAYRALSGEGFSRIDFFLEEKTGDLYLNEMNTIPGFTAYSMFPLLWEAKGLTYPKVIERIIELGYERYNAQNNR
jgi:D-alanine-D-alanine ligase